MYAIVKTGGKQFKVAVGDKIRVELIEKALGETVELSEVLLVADENGIKVGQPFLAGAKVTGEVLQQGRAAKIHGFHYRKRKKYRKTWGHRQYFTELQINTISA